MKQLIAKAEHIVHFEFEDAAQAFEADPSISLVLVPVKPFIDYLAEGLGDLALDRHADKPVTALGQHEQVRV